MPPTTPVANPSCGIGWQETPAIWLHNMSTATTANHLSPRRIRSEGRGLDLRFSDNFHGHCHAGLLADNRECRRCAGDHRDRRVDLDHFPGADDLRLSLVGGAAHGAEA